MISEIDLEDWEKGEPTELYNVPRNTYVETVDTGWRVLFHHIDGGYSFCHDVKSGEVCHLRAWADVYPLKEKNEV